MLAGSRLSALTLLVLAATLGLKLCFLGSWQFRDPAAPQQGGDKAAVAAFLQRQGFTVAETEDRPEFQFLRAASGPCRLLVALAAPQGWNRDIIRRLAEPDDQVAFAFNGRLYADQPSWRTWIDYHWRWLGRAAGLDLPTRPVLGLVASPECRLDTLPWRDVTELR